MDYDNYRTLIVEGLVDYMTELYSNSQSTEFAGAPDYTIGRKFWSGALTNIPLEEIIKDLMNENIEPSFAEKLTAQLGFNPFILDIKEGKLVVLNQINVFLDKL
jgi:hypothetical protein